MKGVTCEFLLNPKIFLCCQNFGFSNTSTNAGISLLMHFQANQTDVTFTSVRALLSSWCFRAELVRKAQGEYFAEEVQIQRPGIRGTQVKSSVRIKKCRNHLNGYFGAI